MTPSIRPPKKRSRNFDGCWTCRVRKIKCDCTRPTCLRCQRANLSCQGYAIVLAWADPLSVNRDGHLFTVKTPKIDGTPDPDKLLSRRNVALTTFPPSMLYETFAELNAVVALFDDPSPHLQSVSSFARGPFLVFRHLKAPPAKSPTKPSKSMSTPMSSSTSKIITPAPPPPPTPARSGPGASIFSETDNTYVHYALLDSAKLTTLAIKGPAYVFSDQSMFHILYPNFFPNIDSDQWSPPSNIMDRYLVANPNGLLLTSAMLSVSAHLSALAISFVRIVHPNNPWDLHVLPFIKQLLFEMVVEEYPSSQNWLSHRINKENPNVPRDLLLNNIRLAILYMVLATSSFLQSGSLSGKVKNDPHSFFIDDQLKSSIEFRKLGILILDYHMDEYDNNSLFPEHDSYEAHLLLALLLQINLDNLFGVFENYELIYAIGDFITKGKLKSSHRRLTPLERFLRDVFEILHIFYGSTQAINLFNYSIPEEDLRQKYQDLNENYDLSKGTPFGNTTDDETSDEEEGTISRQIADKNGIELTKTASPNYHDNSLSFTVHFNQNSPKSPLRNIRSPNRLSSSNPVTPQLGDKSIYVSYGIPKSLLQLFNDVVHLTNHKNIFLSRGVFPRNYPRICAETEDTIRNWNVESYWKLYDNEYNTITNLATKAFITPFHEGLFYNVLSFYYALRVYFKRLISNVPRRETQNDVAASLDAMEKLMQLNASIVSEKKSTYFSPSFWAVFICGCDIESDVDSDLHQRCRKLWDLDTFGKHNYWRSKQILYEVWKRRSEGEDVGFIDLIREWDVALNLG